MKCVGRGARIACLTVAALCLWPAPAAPAQTLTQLVGVQGNIFDANVDRVLYRAMNGELRIRNVATGQETVVPIPRPVADSGDGRLIEGGAIYWTAPQYPQHAQLVEYRNGQTTELGPIMAHPKLQVRGDYALWNSGTGGIRRQISTSTNVPAPLGYLAPNGDIAYIGEDEEVYRWRNGVVTLMSDAPSNPDAAGTMTDGQWVVWRSFLGQLAFNPGTGEQPVVGSDGDDYRVAAGWIAFQRAEETELWTRDPAGDYGRVWAATPARHPGLVGAGLSPDGQTMFAVGDTEHYLGAAGEEPFLLPPPSHARQSFWSNGRWYVWERAGGTMHRVEPDTAFTQTPPARTESDDVTFKLASTVRAAAFECRLNDGPWSSCPRNATLNDVPEGSNTFSARSTGDATPVAFTWLSDHSPPEPFALLSPADGATVYGDHAALSWEAAKDPGSGIATYRLWVDGERHYPGKATSWNVAVTHGTHTWRVDAVDGFDHVRSSETRTFTLAADTAPPGAFALTAPGDGAAVTEPRPLLSWEPAPDGGTGVHHYELRITNDAGTHEASVTDTSYRPAADLPPGLQTWTVKAVDGVGNARQSSTRTFSVDLRAPSAALAVDANPTVTGALVRFDAGASTDADSRIARYEWDLDGDGGFETDTGPTGAVSHRYATVGRRTVSVRVTDLAGRTSTAALTIDVFLAPPPGPPGVSINGGARFTNDPDVTVTIRWPHFARAMLLADDGGFAGAQEQPLATTFTWRLDTRGSQRVARTVYVRFLGGVAGDATHQDDIVLDTKRPRVRSAKRTGRRVRVRATDAVSGVKTMQLARDRARPGRARPYRRTVTASTARWVRVTDAAGNRSKWRRITARR